MAAGPSSSGTKFDEFYNEIKGVEKRDQNLTPAKQIERLLRPGSTYLNLNPFEVLQLPSTTTVEEAKKAYKKLSLLIHPDKNLDDRERADKAFAIIKQAIATIEDPDKLSECRDTVDEATAIVKRQIDDKRRKLKRDNKPATVDEDEPDKFRRAVWVATTKLFADRERKRKILEERANDEKRRRAEEDMETASKKKLEAEWQQGYEETRDERMGKWQTFQKKKDKKKTTKKLLGFKPPKQKLEKSGIDNEARPNMDSRPIF